MSNHKFLDLLGAGIENISESFYDIQAKNAAEQKRNSGLVQTIKRTVLGSCCDWCEAMAGTYEYREGKYPEDIFKRHLHCRCLVTVNTVKGRYQDVWSKKEYSSEREARIEREKELEDAKDNVLSFEKAKNIARDNGQTVIDATSYWLNKPKEKRSAVFDTSKEFYYWGSDGNNAGTYIQDGTHIFINKDPEEERVANLLVDKFGGIIQRYPEIKDPEGCQTPDYLFNGERYDLKTLFNTSGGERSIENVLKPHKRQADSFILDISSGFYHDKWELCVERSKRTMEKRDWISRIIVVDKNDIVSVIERI